MSMTEVQILLASIGGLLVVLGTGTSWLLKHIENLQSKEALENIKARTELAERLRSEINVLRADVAQLQDVNRLYLRRIYQLESFIHQQPGINIPSMNGWPPE
jgi:hypothetical protein